MAVLSDTLLREAEVNGIRRHRTAIHRVDHSLPIKCLLRDNLAGAATTILDYGCGHGVDVRLLRERGYQCNGWDPAFCPDGTLDESDVVNLGYVINVIENLDERAETVHKAWRLCRRLLIISAQIQVSGRGTAWVPFNDGVVTRLGTFQRYFGQDELRTYIEALLGVPAIAAAPGIFYVFRDDALREAFLAGRYRRRSPVPKRCNAEQRFETHRRLLEPLIEVISDLGRMPAPEEYEQSDSVDATFGSMKQAFALIQKVTGSEPWETIRKGKSEDLVVYLGLSRFWRRPSMSRHPLSLQRDIKAFFRTYRDACTAADELLFRAGDAAAVDAACRESSVGKLLPDALYVHRSAVDYLHPLLRMYEGCARLYVGEIEDATLVKLHRLTGKVSYLAYPEFDADPHPALQRGVKVDLRSREISCYDYNESENPPVLHRKETFVHRDYPLYQKFARLSEQEDRHGLLAGSSSIGTRNGWNARLQEHGYALRGHRLVKRPLDS